MYAMMCTKPKICHYVGSQKNFKISKGHNRVFIFLLRQGARN